MEPLAINFLDIAGKPIIPGSIVIYGYERGELAEGEVISTGYTERWYQDNVPQIIVKRPDKSLYYNYRHPESMPPPKIVRLQFPDRIYVTEEISENFWQRIQTRWDTKPEVGPKR